MGEEVVVGSRVVPGERRLFAELCEGVEAQHLAGDQPAYRRAKDKSDRSLELYKFFVNALYVALTRAVRQVILVEDDLGHPLLGLLGVGRPESAASVQAEKSSAEEWRREAHRVGAQGEAEHAGANRAQVVAPPALPRAVVHGQNPPPRAD